MLILAIYAECIGISEFRMNYTVSDLISLKAKYNAKGYYIVQAYIGDVIPSFKTSLDNAYAAGFTHADLVVTPCAFHECEDAATIVSKVNQALQGEIYEMIWVSLNANVYYNVTQKNVDYFVKLVNMFKANQRNVGIRLRYSTYTTIMGNFTGFNDLPMWYISYDNQGNFNDFVAIGGWTKPAMKSYFQIASGPNSAFSELFYY